MMFNFKQMVLKGVKVGILFGLPMLVNQFIIAYPDYAQLTVGALLTMFVNYIKIRYGDALKARTGLYIP